MGMTQALERHPARNATAALLALLIAGCGGGDTGNERDSGREKTTLSVSASDPDGDALRYEWRVTAGTVENRNASQTVWSLPAGPGLHFAYVMVSDGRGGYAEQQYAVGTDALADERPAAARPAVPYPIAASAPGADGTALRLRMQRTGLVFDGSGPASTRERVVYLPDVAVRVSTPASGVVFSGTTDANGELDLPQLAAGPTYSVDCSAMPGSVQLSDCANTTFEVSAERSSVVVRTPTANPGHNLRLHGHVSLGDEGVCGTQNEFFGVNSAATVSLLQANGQALGAPVRVNRFGDYSLHAAVSVTDATTVRFACGAQQHDIVLAPASDAALRNALVNALPVERSYRFDNRRPVIARLLANGPDGNVRGRLVVEEPGAISKELPGSYRFLSYKGIDSALSACSYYRSFGAVAGCDAQGRMQGAISFEDWKRRHRFAPYTEGNTEVAATYINQRDLNLVRRMVATQTAADTIAFYVCNNPGPEGRTQAEVDKVIRFGIAGERRVACVAMEWSVTEGVNGNQPFTKFLTFGPDGSLIGSVNLDQRGEKFMPGACVACHGGARIGARFPTIGKPSPMLGARFLPFDTGNFLFSSRVGLSESAQGAAFRELNRLVAATEGPAADTPTTRLVNGWYAAGDNELDKSFVPGDPTSATGWHESSDKANFYREVIGTSCRTCHTALGSAFDWDSRPNRFTGTDGTVHQHVCGGSADLSVNATMPNASASLNRLLVDHPPDSALRQRMNTYLGCNAPADDPAYRRR
jgi:hypothetical protein